MEPVSTPALVPPVLASESGAKRAPGQVLALTGLLGAGFLLGGILSSIASPSVAALFQPVAVTTLSGWAALLLASIAALVLHETGHLLASLACRFEVLTISIGPLRLSQGQLGWTSHINKTRLFTGSVVAIPRTNESWRERMLLVVAAGPGATLLTALAAACPIYTHMANGWMLSLLTAFVQISFFIFVLGLLPNSPKSRVQNDATLFLILWQDGKAANEIFLYHLVLQLQMAGLEPRHFPLWLVELMAGFQGRPDFMILYADMLATWAFDRGDFANGNAWDARALQLSARGSLASRNASLANSACFDLVFRNDRESAKNKLAAIQVETILSPTLKHRTIAARNLALGQIARTLAEVASARYFLPTKVGMGGLECFLLKRLHASAVSVR